MFKIHRVHCSIGNLYFRLKNLHIYLGPSYLPIPVSLFSLGFPIFGPFPSIVPCSSVNVCFERFTLSSCFPPSSNIEYRLNNFYLNFSSMWTTILHYYIYNTALLKKVKTNPDIWIFPKHTVHMYVLKERKSRLHICAKLACAFFWYVILQMRLFSTMAIFRCMHHGCFTLP